MATRAPSFSRSTADSRRARRQPLELGEADRFAHAGERRPVGILPAGLGHQLADRSRRRAHRSRPACPRVVLQPRAVRQPGLGCGFRRRRRGRHAAGAGLAGRPPSCAPASSACAPGRDIGRRGRLFGAGLGRLVRFRLRQDRPPGRSMAASSSFSSGPFGAHPHLTRRGSLFISLSIALIYCLGRKPSPACRLHAIGIAHWPKPLCSARKARSASCCRGRAPLRCGKRPKRAMMSRCSTGIFLRAVGQRRGQRRRNAPGRQGFPHA